MMVNREIEERGRPDTDVDHVYAGPKQSAAESSMQTRRAQPTVTAHSDPLETALRVERAEASTERAHEVIVEIAFSMAADVVLPKDVRVHAVTPCRPRAHEAPRRCL